MSTQWYHPLVTILETSMVSVSLVSYVVTLYNVEIADISYSGYMNNDIVCGLLFIYLLLL